MPSEAAPGERLSVLVLIDWQNTYKGAREAFNLVSAGPIAGNVDPWKLARVLAKAQDPTGEARGLKEVRIYRGAPSPRRDPKTYSAYRAQTAKWERDGGARLKVCRRALRYPPPEVINAKPREKGVDVKLAVDLVEAAIRERADRVVVVSTDTDLLPAIELAVDERGERFVETAGWDGPGDSAALLTIKGHSLKRWPLRRALYDTLIDATDFTRPAAERRAPSPRLG